MSTIIKSVGLVSFHWLSFSLPHLFKSIQGSSPRNLPWQPVTVAHQQAEWVCLARWSLLFPFILKLITLSNLLLFCLLLTCKSLEVPDSVLPHCYRQHRALRNPLVEVTENLTQNQAWTTEELNGLHNWWPEVCPNLGEVWSNVLDIKKDPSFPCLLATILSAVST